MAIDSLTAGVQVGSVRTEERAILFKLPISGSIVGLPGVSNARLIFFTHSLFSFPVNRQVRKGKNSADFAEDEWT